MYSNDGFDWYDASSHPGTPFATIGRAQGQRIFMDRNQDATRDQNKMASKMATRDQNKMASISTLLNSWINPML